MYILFKESKLAETEKCMEGYVLIKQGRIYNGIEEQPWTGDILIKNGKIEKLAEIIEGRIVNDAEIIDATGFNVYPGFVEAHCHLGLDGYTGGLAEEDFNELNDCITPQLSAVDGINPMDITFKMAREAGVTCVCSGPGSSNVLGGTFCVLKTVGRRIDDMLVKEKAAMKCAFGENPKACYQDQSVSCRMTIAAKLREMLQKTVEYEKERGPFDAKLEALLPVIRKEIPLKAHVHRADDIFTAIRIAKEFGLRMTLDHCSEGHLIADALASEGYPAIIGPDFATRNKIEVQNVAFKTAGILARAGVMVAVTTDHPVSLIQSLPLCVGLSVKHGLPLEDGYRAMTINAAKMCGTDDRVGSIEVGKDADIAIFDGNPMETFTETLMTIIDGKIVYRAENCV